MDEEKEVIGYCIHCKNEIHIHQSFVTDNGELYHYTPCYKQLDEDGQLKEEENVIATEE